MDLALSGWLHDDVYGQVMGVYEKCFNILTNDGLIVGVFGDTPSLMPLSILTDISDKNSFFHRHIQDGDNVYITGGILSVPGAQFTCLLSNSERQEMHRCAAGAVDRNVLQKQTMLLARLLLTYGKANGEGKNIDVWEDILFKGKNPGNTFRILFPLATLIQAIRLGDEESIYLSFNRTIGAGIGLTPSADDIICGISYALYMFDSRKISATFLSTLRNYVRKCGRDRTTLVSAQQLELSSQGIMSDPVYELLCAIAQNAPEELLRQTLCRTLDYGSSSGTELCMGILAGCCIANTVC